MSVTDPVQSSPAEQPPAIQSLQEILAGFQPGTKTTVYARVMLHRHDPKQMKSGAPWEILVLGDATATCDVKDFDCLAQGAGHPRFLVAKLDLEDYKGSASLILRGLRPMDEADVRIEDFVRIDREMVARCRAQFDAELDAMRPGPYRDLVAAMFDDTVRDKFFFWPAASKNHHNYAGGLAEHTLEVLRYARAVAQADDLAYDPDLLTAGCLIHDIGKLDEYAAPPVLARSTAGELAYHLAFGHMRLGAVAERLRLSGVRIPDAAIFKLMHLIEQSHGAHRLDQARMPLLKEARCLAAADQMSASSAPSDRLAAAMDAVAALED